jgi:FixJ family two-component response regulator
MSVRAMKAGAVEFLTKPFRDQDLLDAIQVAIERDMARVAAAAPLADLQRRSASLTTREREMMRLVVGGRANKPIASNLGISEITVRVHRAQLMRKLGANSVAELVRAADKLEAVETTPPGKLYERTGRPHK